MNATMKDIALQTGVTVATVSRVLNDTASISRAVREKVLKAARDLNYYPNFNARILSTKRSYAIGLSVPSLDFMFGGFFQEILRGVEAAINRRGYSLHLTRFSGSGQNTFDHSVRSGVVDGTLVLGDKLSLADLDRLRGLSLPVVLLNRRDPNRSLPNVYVDNIRGGYLAGEHLLSHDYRNLVFIGGEKSLHVTRERLQGFERAMRSCADGRNILRRVYYGSFAAGLEQGYRLSREISGEVDAATGIFAANDHLVIGMLKGFQEKGFKEGGLPGIIGYDNLDVNASLSPALTSIDQQGLMSGDRAASVLIDIIEGKDTDRVFEISPYLVRRVSCGCS